MATVSIATEGGLLIVSVSGNLTAEEIISVVRDLYPVGRIKDVIWDLSNASLSSVSRMDFEKIARFAKTAVANGFRQRGKTACVGNSAAEFGLIHMYTSIAEMTGVPIGYSVFKTREEAREWIAGD